MEQNNSFIPVYEPVLKGNEWNYLKECIKTNWISSKGKFIEQFEASFANYNNVAYALTTSNGTTALHLALISLGIKKGDEVIVPDLTFAASINSILYCGAKPILVDIERDTFNIDTHLIEQKITSVTKAIMPVHLYGNPCNMDDIIKIANKYKLFVIEDSAEAFGSEYKSKKVGTFGDSGCFSFYGNKTITTGEGGMIVYKDKKLYEKAKILRDHGMDPQKPYWHQHVGYNYRMTNMQAAIGLAQLERANNIISRKIEIANVYKEHLCDIDGIHFPFVDKNNLNTYWLVSIVLDSKLKINRDELQKGLFNFGIDSRPFFYPIHIMPPYHNLFDKRESFPNSSFISAHGLSLPSSVNLTNNKIKYICQKIKEIINYSD